MKNTYFSTAIGLYFNYLVHGMGVILMSLNMSALEQQWQTNAAGVSIVISSLGIGRLSVLLVAGMLSDRYGRRPFIIFGMTCYLIFFVPPFPPVLFPHQMECQESNNTFAKPVSSSQTQEVQQPFSRDTWEWGWLRSHTEVSGAGGVCFGLLCIFVLF